MERIETIQECQFLTKPSIKAKDLSYLKSGSKIIYANLFKIAFNKNMVVYQYPISFDPVVSLDNPRMKRALYSIVEDKVRNVYGECFMSGESIFSLKEVSDLKQFPFTNPKNKIEYVLIVRPKTNTFAMNDENPLQNPAVKQIYEMIFKEILRSNPNLEFYRNLFVKTKEMKSVSSEKNKVDFYPGYSTSLIYTTFGPFVNVSIKNKILSTSSCLEILLSKKSSKGKFSTFEEEEIREFFMGRSIKTTYNKKNYLIDDVSFDKTPKNTSFNRDGTNINLINYYKVAHGITIKNPDQPLFVHNKVGSNSEPVTLYFVPELCKLAGIDDSITKDGKFMKSLAEYTKLTPKERVARTNDFLQLLDEKSCKIDKNSKSITSSSYEKKNNYGLTVNPAEKNNFNAHFMKMPKMIAGKNTQISPEERKPIPVTSSMNLTNWIFVYYKNNYDDANNLLENLKKASKSYGIKVEDPRWVEMASNKLEDWKYEVTEEIKSIADDKSRKDVVVIFLLDRYLDKLYKGLKLLSLCDLGFRSQVVKCESMQKNSLSVASKILLQINSKLGGSTYTVDFDKDVKNQRLMIVAVDSSHISGKRTGVAMVATIKNDFTQYYNRIDIIEEKTKETLVFCVASFLRESINKYFKSTGKLPTGIVIYRQGVSKEQKNFLKSEVMAIENFLNGTDDDQFLKNNPIPYYYILVNTKTSIKFFEKTSQMNKVDFLNPERGLLVFEDITNPMFFEFYIQPQDVTQGTATPTLYHVAFGNLSYPEFIPKLTFDLCFLYANWTGPVRVPGPLKAAEKLSKMTAKYTKKELHELLKCSQAYL